MNDVACLLESKPKKKKNDNWSLLNSNGSKKRFTHRNFRLAKQKDLQFYFWIEYYLFIVVFLNAPKNLLFSKNAEVEKVKKVRAI